MAEINNIDDFKKEFEEAITQPGQGDAGFFRQIDAVTRLRELLDEGEIKVSEFLEEGKKAGSELKQTFLTLGSQGSDRATLGTQLNNLFQQKSGFKFDDRGELTANLPEEFEERLRDELIPENITGEEREKLIEDIPHDIGFDTDRFELEREGVRQRLQLEKTAAEQKVQRGERLNELEDLLVKQADEAFDVNRPEILEDLNARGLFDSSGVGTAFGQEKARQNRITQNALASQSIADRDADIGALADVLNVQRGFQTQGLSRELSLDDFHRQNNAAFRFAELTKPDLGSAKGGGGAGALSGAATGASAGSAFGPYGTAIGAGVGGVGGYFAGRR